jgi:broad specificity phosphatase PhoE
MSASSHLDRVPPLSEPLAVGAFHFLRHGRTDHNLRRIVQGHMDIPLDDTGRAEASAAAEFLAGAASISRIVSSDLARTRETAERIGARLGLSPELDPGLRERCFGAFEGEPAPADIWNSTADGMETIEDFAARIAGALLRHGKGQGVLIVAHGGVLRVAARLLRAELPAEALRNATPLFFSRSNDGWSIAHLAPDLAAAGHGNILEPL